MRLACALLFLTVTACCRADDWPRWRGADATGCVRAGVAVPTALAAAPPIAWRIPIGTGHASPVVSGGRIYYLDGQHGKEVAHAANTDSGKEIWSAPLDDLFRDQQGEPGPRCTPVVDGDRLYVQSCLGEFRCLRAADGQQVWRTNFVKDFGAQVPAEEGDHLGGDRHGRSGPPVIDGDRIYVAVGSHAGASVVCFNKRDGRVLWKSQNDAPGHIGPVVATVAGVKQLVDFTGVGLIGLDLGTGALLWRVPITSRFGRHAMTPVVVGDMVVVGSITVGLVGVRVRKQGAGFTAERAWTVPSLGVNFSSPVSIGNYLHGLGPLNTLFCVDVTTGEKAWAEQRFFSQIVHTDFAAFLGMGANVLALTDGGWLVMVSAGPKECHEIGRAQVCGRNWCSPAYAAGRLYLRDAKELFCFRMIP